MNVGKGVPALRSEARRGRLAYFTLRYEQ
jgi:hypothetical protein